MFQIKIKRKITNKTNMLESENTIFYYISNLRVNELKYMIKSDINVLKSEYNESIYVYKLGTVSKLNPLQYLLARIINYKFLSGRYNDKKDDKNNTYNNDIKLLIKNNDLYNPKIYNEILNFIIKYINLEIINHHDIKGNTILHYISLYGNKKLLKYVLIKDIIIQKNSDNKFPSDLGNDEIKLQFKEFIKNSGTKKSFNIDFNSEDFKNMIKSDETEDFINDLGDVNNLFEKDKDENKNELLKVNKEDKNNEVIIKEDRNKENNDMKEDRNKEDSDVKEDKNIIDDKNNDMIEEKDIINDENNKKYMINEYMDDKNNMNIINEDNNSDIIKKNQEYKEDMNLKIEAYNSKVIDIGKRDKPKEMIINMFPGKFYIIIDSIMGYISENKNIEKLFIKIKVNENKTYTRGIKINDMIGLKLFFEFPLSEKIIDIKFVIKCVYKDDISRSWNIGKANISFNHKDLKNYLNVMKSFDMRIKKSSSNIISIIKAFITENDPEIESVLGDFCYITDEELKKLHFQPNDYESLKLWLRARENNYRLWYRGYANIRGDTIVTQLWKRRFIEWIGFKIKIYNDISKKLISVIDLVNLYPKISEKMVNTFVLVGNEMEIEVHLDNFSSYESCLKALNLLYDNFE